MTRSTYTSQGRKILNATPAGERQDTGGRAWAIEYRDDPEAIGENDRDGTNTHDETEEEQSK